MLLHRQASGVTATIDNQNRAKSWAANRMPRTFGHRSWGLLDYDFHLFTEKGTGTAGVLYRGGPPGYRLALVAPTPADQLNPFELPVTISAQPAPCLTHEEATERLGLLGLLFLFFIDAAQGRASVLYHRYDGHYGLITPAG